MVRKPALGKGLNALIPETVKPESTQAVESRTGSQPWIQEIPLNSIDPNPDQPRNNFSQTELSELAESIRKHGLLQPVLVRKSNKSDRYILVSGERRVKASSIAGLKKIPAIITDPKNPEGSLTIALVENIQRSDLDDIELAKAYKRLMDEFMRSHDEIASIVGKSRPHITNTLRLLELTEQMQKALSEGKITAGHARALLIVPEEKRSLLFEDILRKSLNVRESEKLAKKMLKTKRAKPNPDNSRLDADEIEVVLRDMELHLESALQRKVRIHRNKNGKGNISAEFYSDKDLEKLYSNLLHALDYYARNFKG